MIIVLSTKSTSGLYCVYITIQAIYAEYCCTRTITWRRLCRIVIRCWGSWNNIRSRRFALSAALTAWQQ